MQIEEQIKKLLRIKTKIELYNKVLVNITEETKIASEEHAKLEKEYPGLLQEFCSEVVSFCKDRVHALDQEGSYRNNVVPPVAAVVEKRDEPKKPVVLEEENNEPKDPLRFLLKYKHLDSKKVNVSTPDGDVSGTVRGLVVPYLIVETETGYTIRVEPNKVKVA